MYGHHPSTVHATAAIRSDSDFAVVYLEVIQPIRDLRHRIEPGEDCDITTETLRCGSPIDGGSVEALAETGDRLT